MGSKRNTPLSTCPDCNGYGIGPYYPADTVRCRTCGGEGLVPTKTGAPPAVSEPTPCVSGSCRQNIDDSTDHIPDAGKKVPPLTVRTEVVTFAMEMEAALRRNDYKGGWRDIDRLQLECRLEAELDELKFALRHMDAKNIAYECCDVANYAMMIFHNFGKE